MRVRTVPLLVLIAISLGAAAARGAVDITPAEIALEIGPASKASTGVTLTNRGDGTAMLRILLVDGYVLPDGTEESLAPGMLDRSCAGWLTLETGELELAPGESRRIGIDVAVPPGADGTHWTRIRVEELEEPSDGGAPVVVRQGMVRLFVDAAGAVNRAATLSHLVIERAESGDRPLFRVRARNSGNGLLRCRCRFEVQQSGWEGADTLRIETPGSFLLYPFADREMTAVPDLTLPDGPYVVRAILDCGGTRPIIAGAPFIVAASATYRSPPMVRPADQTISTTPVPEKEPEPKPGAPAPPVREEPAPPPEVAFRVQIFATGDKTKAEELAGEAQALLGQTVSVEFSKPYYKVIVGEALTMKEAKVLRSRAKEAGFTEAWIKRQSDAATSSSGG